MRAKKFYWEGQSGTKYEYWSNVVETPMNDVPGNYIFAKEVSPDQFQAVYIGQTSSLENRLPGHEKLPCIREHGATHIHVRQNDEGESARLAEEKDLIAKEQPACNEVGVR